MQKAGVVAVAAVWLLASCTTHRPPSTGDNAANTHKQPVSSVPVAPKAQAVAIQTNPFAAPDDPSTITYDSGLVTRPIDAAYLPSIDAVAAVEAATRIGFNATQQPGVPSVTLRSVSIGYEGQRAYGWHPARVVIWRGGEPWTTGGVHRSPRPAPAPTNHSHCMYVVVVNAASGRAEDARQLCKR